MYLKNLSLQNFRNYSELSILFPPRGALFEGLNGAGKTNILESIYLLCTGRSQRGAARTDMISFERDTAFAEGEFCFQENGAKTTASIGFSRNKKIVMKRDGLDVRSYSEWFGKRPVVSFGADDLLLVYGAPELRRKFLDMLICQMDSVYFDALIQYRKNMANRNALLANTNDAAQFEVYEEAMAKSASVIVLSRAQITLELCELLAEIYAKISNSGEVAFVEYAQKIKQKINDFSDVCEWQNVYLNTLCANRQKDRELMFTASGPHRDDLRFFVGGAPAKSYASQGQCRTFALSLKLASVSLLERRLNEGMIFLIDDAVSELDGERTSRVYPLLAGRGQIFVATPLCRADLGEGILRCTVSGGKVAVEGGGGGE